MAYKRILRPVNLIMMMILWLAKLTIGWISPLFIKVVLTVRRI